MDNGIIWLYIGICLGGAGVWFFWRSCSAEERQRVTEGQLRETQYRLSRLERDGAAQAAATGGGYGG